MDSNTAFFLVRSQHKDTLPTFICGKINPQTGLYSCWEAFVFFLSLQAVAWSSIVLSVCKQQLKGLLKRQANFRKAWSDFTKESRAADIRRDRLQRDRRAGARAAPLGTAALFQLLLSMAWSASPSSSRNERSYWTHAQRHELVPFPACWFPIFDVQ